MDPVPRWETIPVEGRDADIVDFCLLGFTVWVVHGPPGPRRQSLAQSWRGHVTDEIFVQEGDLHGSRELAAFRAGIWLDVVRWLDWVVSRRLVLLPNSKPDLLVLVFGFSGALENT
jgi:hypothetical protein